MRGQLPNAFPQGVTNTPRDISKKQCHSNKPQKCHKNMKSLL